MSCVYYEIATLLIYYFIDFIVEKFRLISRKINNKEALREEVLVWDLDDFKYIKNERIQ